MKCANNLKQLGLAMHNYEAATGEFPAGWMGNSGLPAYIGFPDYFFSWSVLAQLNPYLEQTNIYNTMDLKQPIYMPPAYNITPPTSSRSSRSSGFSSARATSSSRSRWRTASRSSGRPTTPRAWAAGRPTAAPRSARP